MKKLAIVGLLFVVGCGSAEEWQRIQAEDAARRSSNVASVQRQLARSYGEIRPRTFHYSGPRSGAQPAYDYIREIGGSVTNRRAAFYELRITVNVSARRTDWCEGQVIAQILDIQPPQGRWEVIAQGSKETFWTKCQSPPERLVFEALANMS